MATDQSLIKWHIPACTCPLVISAGNRHWFCEQGAEQVNSKCSLLIFLINSQPHVLWLSACVWRSPDCHTLGTRMGGREVSSWLPEGTRAFLLVWPTDPSASSSCAGFLLLCGAGPAEPSAALGPSPGLANGDTPKLAWLKWGLGG